METNLCRRCGREIYIVTDNHGDNQELDATASTFRLRNDLENRETAEPAADAYVHHRFTCPRKETLHA